MNTSLDCIPCFARQTLEAARFFTDDPQVHGQALREVLRYVADMDLTHSPPTVAQRIHRRLREIVGAEDPYRQVKDSFNRMAMEMLDDLAVQVASSDDPLMLAMRLAIAGNVIDLGVDGGIDEDDARRALGAVLDEPFYGQIETFRAEIDKAERILYLADNCGEVVFDQLLIRQLPTERVTVAVRGGPILNDATMDDARATGLCDLVEVIDNGSDAPGTILSDCSERFQDYFGRADLILAKGQGNFETLSEVDANIYFLLKVKCPVIARHIGFPVGTHIAMHGVSKTLSAESCDPNGRSCDTPRCRVS